MIRLLKVSLALRDKDATPAAILNQVSIALPSERRIGLIGDNPRELTELLGLLSGARRPDAGRVELGGLRCSPVVNGGNAAGRTLAPGLTVAENLRQAARTHGIEESLLASLVEARCRLGPRLADRIQDFDWPTRRQIEATLIAAIPFDCYYIDRLHQLDGPLIWQFVHVAARRGAGIIFTTQMPKQLGRFAEFGARVGNGSIELGRQITSSVPGNGE
jgi:hypothetical protein